MEVFIQSKNPMLNHHKAKRKFCPSEKIANFSRNYPHEVNSRYGIQGERACGDEEVNAL